ncbi:serine endopeptidase [Sodiomyces alkalinus F11]|uniref:Serine endopeptidase n=1 Tax=Sodiomyces alkalinus (strain CBS 110278 / VKM F-3762 / F11) TaxID=1314773 RepID=A0A3N2Q7E1_SODAK|nr:serine endopeptidase [Sodiomyces alkalinus F11]ROT42545.1 serine endopeptidase [Sodiomyces alkalinus F11]
MRLNSLILGLPLAGSALAANLDPRQSTRIGESDEGTAPVAKSFIIEYSRAAVRRRQESLASDDNITVVKTFETDIFSGISVETDTHNIDSLLRLPDVVNVWLNEEVRLAPIEVHRQFSDDAAAADYSTHNATGVSKLHDQGYFGKGVKIGVVDTGIYYLHEALGSGIGPGFKVEGGYDFVGNGFWPSEPAEPSDDPLDYGGHGTHVAGIIAGQTGFWKGVAPEATLYAYKVFSQSPSTTTSVLIEAFLRAYEDGCDIITASIGGANGWSNNLWAEVASRLVEEGVVVTISAGNSGAAGPFFGTSGGSGRNVVTVASLRTELFPASPFEATFSLDGESNTTKVGYLPATFYFPPSVAGWPIVPLTLDTSVVDDACQPFGEDGPDLTGKVALVRRGTCNFAVKQQNVAALGAEYVLIYTDDRPIVTPSTDHETTLLGMVTAEAGGAIIGTILAGGNVTADFSVNPEEVVGLEYPAGGLPSTFTSWSALYDLQIKPDIAAPGGDIFSAYPNGEYAVTSGTSMACPYVAGVAALWISAYGGREVHGKGYAKELGERIISSGTSVPWSDGTETDYGHIAPVAQVGNGLVNAFKVLKYDTALRFDKIALNDTRYFSRYHDVTVTNNGEEAVTYTFSAEHGAGVETVGWLPTVTGGFTKRLKRFVELVPIDLEVDISFPRAFTLQPGESRTVSVNFRNPDTLGWNATALPLYSGKVIVSGSNGERLSVPFLGLGADLKRQTDPIYHNGYPFSVSGVNNVDINQDSSYSFDLSVDAQDFPKVYNRINWGSRQVRWDIFEAGWRERNWKYPPVEGENGYIGPAAGWSSAGSVAVFNPAIHNPNTTFTFPITDVYRNAETTAIEFRYYWFGKLGNGSLIANGRYKMRFATLKPFGNPHAADNWDVFHTPEIEVTGQHY